MIDVVFNLVIFFLAASHLARSQVALPVNLPEAAGGRPEEAQKASRLTITVLADGQYSVAGEIHRIEQLEALLAPAPAPAGLQELLEVRIRADRQVPYRAIEPLLLSCARHGVTRIRFAVAPARLEPR
jgi:biopolymer transport protein ExbD